MTDNKQFKLQVENTLENFATEISKVINKVIAEGDLEVMIKAEEILKRLSVETIGTTSKPSELVKWKDRLLQDKAGPLEDEAEFMIGLYKFQKLQKYTNRKVDIKYLEKVAGSDDVIEKCYDKKIKPNDKVVTALQNANVAFDETELLKRDIVEGVFVIKPKN